MDKQELEEIVNALPKTQRKAVTTDTIEMITDMLDDEDMCEAYRENLLGYTRVFSEGKYKLASYLNAVKYVSLKLSGSTNLEAYSSTFPKKISRWQLLGTSEKDVSSYVSIYNKSQLVTKLAQQTMIPVWVLNREIHQKAINTQAELMLTSTSDKVRTEAANSLLNHLKPPEAAKVELDITVKQDSVIDSLRATTEALAAEQGKSIASGLLNAQDVAHQQIVGVQTEDITEGDFVEVDQ